MTKAKNSLPQSWKWRGCNTRDIGSRCDSQRAKTMRKARAASPWLPIR